jgi:hypothetical protein
VARGVYEGPVTMVPGVSSSAATAPDFRDRDLGLYPRALERPTASPGSPCCVCTNVRSHARSRASPCIAGSDASGPGQGSTACHLDGCGPEVVLATLT